MSFPKEICIVEITNFHECLKTKPDCQERIKLLNTCISSYRDGETHHYLSGFIPDRAHSTMYRYCLSNW
jgi:hypothetical protein